MADFLTSFQGLTHILLMAGLAFALALKASRKGRSANWVLLVPVFWSFSAVMFWSLAGAEYDFAGFLLSVIGGVCGGAGMWIIVEGLDPAAALEAEKTPSEAPATEEEEAAPAARACPSCGSQGHERHGAYLCSNPSCNLEFLDEALAPSNEAGGR